MSTTDPWDLYSGTRDRLIELLRSLDSEQATQRVLLTPGWTITNVASHICGINADVASGRLERLGTDERTAHQVAVRAGHTLEDICREWLGHESSMRRAIESDAFLGLRLAADLIVHLHDLQHTLEISIDREDPATLSAAQTYASIIPELLLARCQVAITIELTDGSQFTTPADSGDPPLVLRATPYDFLRSATGRRSAGEVQALDWTGDPAAILDHFSPYGPLRIEDAGV